LLEKNSILRGFHFEEGFLSNPFDSRENFSVFQAQEFFKYFLDHKETKNKISTNGKLI